MRFGAITPDGESLLLTEALLENLAASPAGWMAPSASGSNAAA